MRKKKTIKRRETHSKDEKRSDKRRVKHNYKQRHSKEVQRVLQRKFYKSFRLDRKEDKKILGGKEIIMVNEKITEDFVRSHFKQDSMYKSIKFEE